MKKYKCKLNEADSASYYEAHVFSDSYEDDYDKGEGEAGTSWDEKIKDKSLLGLLKKVADNVNCDNYKELNYEDINEYGDSTELWWSYPADENNYFVSPKDQKYKAWQKGQSKLWVVNCHILVSKIGKSKVDEDELRKLGIRA